MPIGLIDRGIAAPKLSGKMLKEGILSAARHLRAHKGEVDALNVFPVPDGDTGANMSATLEAAAREISQISDDSGFGAAAEQLASAMLRGARGNSGVILSLIFRGFAKSVAGLQRIGGAELANALIQASDDAYQAVTKPQEGTILTVIREAAAKARDIASVKKDDAIAVWTGALHGAREALAKTPSQLPVLRQAGVVDAGGQGLVYAMEGLLQGFLGRSHTDDAFSVPEPQAMRRFLATLGAESPGAAPADIQFAYCVECLIERDNADMHPEELRVALEKIGDCVVVVDDDEIIKIHAHTNRPGDVLNLAQPYGAFMETKVENMKAQSESRKANPAQSAGTAQSKEFGVVAVASGEGLEELFTQLGADALVRGGQSMNPSTEDILRAAERVNAGHVFVLPNNKNIILAAEQVQNLTEKSIRVVHTGSIAEGVAALLEFDESAGAEENLAAMRQAARRVQTGLVTYAARDSEAAGLRIREGDIIGLENGALTLTEHDPVAAAYRVARRLARGHGGTMITVYPGEGVSEGQTRRLLDMLHARYGGDVEISAVPGGQPMYFFIIAVE